MKSVASQIVGNVDMQTRAWLQQICGRELDDDERIAVLVYPPHPAPDLRTREEALSRVRNILKTAASNMQDVSDADFDAAVEEAFDNLRPRPD